MMDGEMLMVLREKPLDGLVHECPVAPAAVESDNRGILDTAVRSRLARRHPHRPAGALGAQAAPAVPGDPPDEAGRVAVEVDPPGPDLAQAGGVRKVARGPAEDRLVH